MTYATKVTVFQVGLVLAWLVTVWRQIVHEDWWLLVPSVALGFALGWLDADRKWTSPFRRKLKP